MKHFNTLVLSFVLFALFSCNSENEVLLKDCNALGGKIRYEGELFTGKVKDIRNGVLKGEFTVENGQKVGEDINYFSDGKTISSINKWKNGKIVQTIYYDKNGKEIGRD
jgi:antitoxin component YwqK of YwqJK toxin-antitoxin module